MERLTQSEIDAYTQSMYDYASISYSLFGDVFWPKFDWSIYGKTYDEERCENDDIPEGKCVESFDDHSYKTLDVRTWVICEKEQQKTIKSLRSKHIPEVRVAQYKAAFPYISAVRLIVGGNPSVELYGFFPYS